MSAVAFWWIVNTIAAGLIGWRAGARYGRQVADKARRDGRRERERELLAEFMWLPQHPHNTNTYRN